MFFRKKYPTNNFIAFFQALGLVIYITLVSLLLINGESWFGSLEFIGPIVLLLIFSTSALICGLIVLGYPIALIFNRQRRQAFKLVIYTAIWLVVFVAAILLYFRFA